MLDGRTFLTSVSWSWGRPAAEDELVKGRVSSNYSCEAAGGSPAGGRGGLRLITRGDEGAIRRSHPLVCMGGHQRSRARPGALRFFFLFFFCSFFPQDVLDPFSPGVPQGYRRKK